MRLHTASGTGETTAWAPEPTAGALAGKRTVGPAPARGTTGSRVAAGGAEVAVGRCVGAGFVAAVVVDVGFVVRVVAALGVGVADGVVGRSLALGLLVADDVGVASWPQSASARPSTTAVAATARVRRPDERTGGLAGPRLT
jgi:hypothetical protein